MQETRLLVIHPPVSVARDFIDYPYFANLGALQLAAVLAERFADARVDLVDAFALFDSRLRWREDGRAHLGASVDEVLARVCTDIGDGDYDAIVVAYGVFHRPPHRDDVLAALLEGLRERFAAPVLLADCYQSGQHYVEVPGEQVLAAYPEVDALIKYEAEVTVPTLLQGWLDDVAAAVAHVDELGAAGVWLAGYGTGGSLAVVEGARNPVVRGVAAMATPSDFDDWAKHPRRLLLHARQVQVIKDPDFPSNFDQWAAQLRSVRPLVAAAELAPRPLLVMHGDRDDLTPLDNSLAIAESHGNAELRVLSGAGHELRHDPRAVAMFMGWLRRQRIASETVTADELAGDGSPDTDQDDAAET